MNKAKHTYLHYTKIDKNWYFWFSNDVSDEIMNLPQKKCYLEEFSWFAGRFTTRYKAKCILAEMFPMYIPIYTYPISPGKRL